jgi:hypothetical protein
MIALLGRWRISITSGGLGTLQFLFAYGAILFVFLFISVHDRSDLELRERADTRLEKTIMVWIDHGYFKHRGLPFVNPVEKGIPNTVHRSTSMAWIQIAHLLQRVHVFFAGEFSLRLMAYHNQFIPLLTSVLLGFLAMRLTLHMDIPYSQSLLLGMSVQTVHQTLPLNLVLIWEFHRQTVIAFLVILFLIIEENSFRKGTSAKTSLSRGFVVFFMAYSDPSGCAAFLMTYYSFRILTMSWQLRFWDIIKTALLPSLAGVCIHLTQVLSIQKAYPEINFTGHTPLAASGFNGNTKFYWDHWDLFSDRWLINLPSSNPLYICGFIALVSVVIFVQSKKRFYSQQIILLSGLGCFLFFAFLLSSNVVMHPYAFQLYLAWPIILALFALLPAWLEVFSLRSGLFVFLSCVMAFFVTGYQLLAYWLSMPPLWYL